MAALWGDGLTVLMVLYGAVNGDILVAYVEHVLVPTPRPGDVVVRDILGNSKRVEARAAIEAAGCTLLFLPPYSRLEPDRTVFSKLKRPPRMAGERTVDGFSKYLGGRREAFALEECTRYFRHAGCTGQTLLAC